MNKYALSWWILARASGKILHGGPLSNIVVVLRRLLTSYNYLKTS